MVDKVYFDRALIEREFNWRPVQRVRRRPRHVPFFRLRSRVASLFLLLKGCN